MKKVVKNQQSDVIILSDVTNENFVGIQWDDGDKSFVIKLPNGRFVGAGEEDLDLESSWTKPSLKKYLEDTIQMGATPYVFDTLKELYQWMVE